MTDESIEKAAELISKSRLTVALTGAGISTPSGIPDFRSPGSGLWEKVDPIEVATIDAFIRKPEGFFKFMEPVSSMMDDADPNAAHLTLAQWESKGILEAVITQNIDNLHQKAGSKNIFELHGNARRAFCMKCKKEYGARELREMAGDGLVPRCDCPERGVIKPDVVLFGELLPHDVLVNAEKLSKQCDVMIVVGSSLTVAPASMLPQMALQNGAKLIVVNLQPTYVDQYADVTLHRKLEEALPQIAEAIH